MTGKGAVDLEIESEERPADHAALARQRRLGKPGGTPPLFSFIFTRQKILKFHADLSGESPKNPLS
jgi:hypothetical protein